MTSWAERAMLDASLRAWRDASIAKACVDLASLRAEFEKQAGIIQAQLDKIKELEQQVKAQSKGKR